MISVNIVDMKTNCNLRNVEEEPADRCTHENLQMAPFREVLSKFYGGTLSVSGLGYSNASARHTTHMCLLDCHDRLLGARNSRALLLSSGSGAVCTRIRGRDIRVGLLLEVRNAILFLADLLRLLEARRFGKSETLVKRAERGDQRQANNDTPD